MERDIHLVSFSIPYPPDYGGAIDVFYKIKALSQQGIKIHLHAFEVGRMPAPELEKYCETVYYYPMKGGFCNYIDTLPCIVKSRISSELSEQLNQYRFPILYEGLQSTASINDLANDHRPIIIRAHNIEHDYYKGLAMAEHSITRKLKHHTEAMKLKGYEHIMHKCSTIAAISPSEHHYFAQKYGHSVYIPAFHPYEKVDVLEGTGQYVLYHGHLSISENIKAALFLIEEIFATSEIPFIIAGKDPDQRLFEAAKINDHIKIVANPDDEEMDRLIRNAHINVLTTFQSTGIKLKLLASLFRGRHCLVNPTMVKDTGLGCLCNVVVTRHEFKEQVERLMKLPFDESKLATRREVLEAKLSNKQNAKKIIDLLFPV